MFTTIKMKKFKNRDLLKEMTNVLYIKNRGAAMNYSVLYLDVYRDDHSEARIVNT